MTDYSGILEERARALNQRPAHRVFVAGREVTKIVSVHTEMGYDVQTPTASFTVPRAYSPWWRTDDEVTVHLGYHGADGGYMEVFRGYVETINRDYSPATSQTTAAGYSKRLMRPYGNTAPELQDPPGSTNVAFTYSNKTDTEIWNDLMRRAGVPRYSAGDGDGVTYATNQEYSVPVGTKLGDIIQKLDESSDLGQRTFEIAGNVLRLPILGVPALNMRWHYAEGVQGLTAPYLPIIDVKRNVSDKGIQNQSIVIFPAAAAATDPTNTDPIPVATTATRQEPNDKVGYDGDGNAIYVPHTLTSDFIEDRDRADAVAGRYMTEFNKETDDLTLRAALNPGVFPGQTCGVTSAKLDLNNESRCWVRHVSHDSGPSGAFTTLQLEGGAGSEGYLIGLPPVANFTMVTTVEYFEVAGVGDTYYTVTCDGSSSYDQDGTIASYAWSANNGDSGTGPVWQTRFTQAQWDAGPEITLTVTDSDTDPTGPHTGTLTLTPDSGDTQTEGMVVAAWDRFDATPDSWQTRFQWTPPGGAKASGVTRLGNGSTFYLWTSDGKIYETTDYLQSDPTEKYDMPGSRVVTAMWISEVEGNKVCIGDDFGNVYITEDAFATAPTLRRTFAGGAIHWITGSIEQVKQWRVAHGSYVWITYDDFLTVGTLSTQANTIEQIELSNFANYNAEDTDANVKVETVGTSITFPALTPAPVHARLAAFLLTDELMATDDQSRAFVKAPGAATFTQVTSVGGGAVYDLVASRVNQKVFYAGAEDGLYKTYDAGQTWYRVLNYTTGTLVGVRIGLASEPVALRERSQIYEFVSGQRFTVGGVETIGVTYPRGLPSDTGVVERPLADAVLDYNAPGIRGYWYHALSPPPSSVTLHWFELTYDDTVAPWDEAGMDGLKHERFGRAGDVAIDDPAVQTYGYVYLRHHFEVPGGNTYQSALLVLSAHDGPVDLYLNEHHIDSAALAGYAQYYEFPCGASGTSVGSCPVARYHIPISAAWLLPGQDNVLAIQIITNRTVNLGGAGYASWKLAINTASNLSQETDGPYTYFVTTEEARVYDLSGWAGIELTPLTGTQPAGFGDRPAGWNMQGYDDSAWNYAVGPNRYSGGVPPINNIDDGSFALGHHSSMICANPGLNGNYGHKHLIRQHWSIPAGTYTEATLDVRHNHAARVFLNGTLVYEGGNSAGVTSGGTTQIGVLAQQLSIDVLSILDPGNDNILAVEMWRDDPPGGSAGSINWASAPSGAGHSWLGFNAQMRVK